MSAGRSSSGFIPSRMDLAMSPPLHIPYREMARDHLDAAKALLEGEGRQLRYACLELRLAIEALTYDVLQAYGDEIDPTIDALEGAWHPKTILDALAAYDPIGDATLVARMRIRTPGGEWQDLNEIREQRFSAAWASKANFALGNFLHQATLAKARAGKGFDEAALRRKAEQVVGEIEAILDTPFVDIRRGFRFGYNCPGCGGSISVGLMALLLTDQARTTCEGCGVTWRAEGGGEDGAPLFTRL